MLVQPANAGWAAAGERGTRFEVNPLAGYMEEFSPTDSFVIETAEGRSVYFNGREDLTHKQTREIAKEKDSGTGYFAYRFEVDGEAVWLDGSGKPLGGRETDFLKQNGVYYTNPDDYLDSTDGDGSATLVVEELITNLLLFVPVGIAAAAAFAPLILRFFTGTLLSLAIEASQLVIGTGGVAGTGDVLVNTTGGVLGAASVVGFYALTARRHDAPALAERAR
ncbi:VanZ family protein [Streptomonospora sp. PA3]|uniref:VanZ family protein n=1 Tax=Streptomonospora sp. PA3 TaxID=2607326 RepID=UPI001642EC47